MHQPRMIATSVALLALLGSGLANAEISSTWTLTSDYDWRGLTQTDEDPALQASIDWADESGWYIGAWASNVDFGPGDPSYEVDLYTGFSGGDEDGLGDTAIVVVADDRGRPSHFGLGHARHCDQTQCSQKLHITHSTPLSVVRTKRT